LFVLFERLILVNLLACLGIAEDLLGVGQVGEGLLAEVVLDFQTTVYCFVDYLDLDVVLLLPTLQHVVVHVTEFLQAWSAFLLWNCRIGSFFLELLLNVYFILCFLVLLARKDVLVLSVDHF